MKKINSVYKILAMVVMFFVLTAGTSFGTTLYWDLSASGITGTVPAEGDSDQLTSLFTQIEYYANINTIQYDTDGDGVLSVGDTYTSQGNVIATGLLPVIGNDEEGINTGYEFTFELQDLVGVVQEIQTGTTYDTVINRYTSGTIEMYIDTTLDASFGSGLGTLDLGDDVGFNDGDSAASVTEVNGIGTSTFLTGTNLFQTGAYDIQGVVSSAMSGLWFTENGNDMSDMTNFTFDWFIGIADGNIDKVAQDFSVATSYVGNEVVDGILYTINSDSNASFEVSPVPEPATMLLLGTSLLGLAGITRKKIVR